MSGTGHLIYKNASGRLVYDVGGPPPSGHYGHIEHFWDHWPLSTVHYGHSFSNTIGGIVVEAPITGHLVYDHEEGDSCPYGEDNSPIITITWSGKLTCGTDNMDWFTAGIVENLAHVPGNPCLWMAVFPSPDYPSPNPNDPYHYIFVEQDTNMYGTWWRVCFSYNYYDKEVVRAYLRDPTP